MSLPGFCSTGFRYQRATRSITKNDMVRTPRFSVASGFPGQLRALVALDIKEFVIPSHIIYLFWGWGFLTPGLMWGGGMDCVWLLLRASLPNYVEILKYILLLAPISRLGRSYPRGCKDDSVVFQKLNFQGWTAWAEWCEMTFCDFCALTARSWQCAQRVDKC